MKIDDIINYIKPFITSGLILYPPLKTTENQRFFGVSRGYKIGTLVRNGLNQHCEKIQIILSCISEVTILAEEILNLHLHKVNYVYILNLIVRK